MNNDLISREALKEAFEITQYNDYDDLKRTESLIDNAPTVTPQAFINGIVELISKNGITTIDELLGILKGGADND